MFRSRLLILPLAFSFACTIGLEIPDGARVTCESQADCPEDLICVPELRRCLPRDGDRSPPSLSDASVTERTNRDGTIVATFTVDETPAKTPTVFLGTGTRPVFQLSSVSGTSYEFELPGSDGVEGEWPVLAEVIDAAGNLATGLSVGTVILDFTAPSVLVADAFVTPTDDNPLRTPVALGTHASSYTVVFNTNEPLAEPPTVEARCSGETAALTREVGETSPTLFTYHLDPSDLATLADSCAVVGDLRDLANNLANDEPIAGLVLNVDRVPPTSAQLDSNLLRHLRVPWGSYQTGYLRGGYLVSSALADTEAPLARLIDAEAFTDGDDPLTMVQIRDASGGLLGVSTRTTQGWEPVQLGTVDVGDILVTLVDRAGNESTPFPVPNGEWVVTLGGESPGSMLNPTEMRAMRWLTDSLRQAGDPGGEPDGIAQVTGSGPERIGAGDWLRLDIEQTPPELHDGGLVWDGARGEAVLFGGVRNAGSITRFPSTYTFDGVHWAAVAPVDPEGDGDPRARSAHATAFDPIRQEVVLFGGTDNAGEDRGDTWVWNGQSWRLAQDASTDGPAPRRWGRASYDPFSGRVLLVGGCRRDFSISMGEDCGEGVTAIKNGNCWFQKTWAWDGQTWSEVATTGPSPRTHFGMATHPTRGVLLYGGGINNANDCIAVNARTLADDAWRWNGAAWEQLATGLPTHNRIAMAYDATSDRIVMMPSSTTQVSVWDQESWVPVRDPSTRLTPPNRSDATLANIGDRGLLMYGGCDFGTNRCNSNGSPGIGDCYSCGDAWMWRDDRWMRVHEADFAGPPANRHDAASTYDPSQPSVLMYGGSIDGVSTNETWRFTGAGWQLVQADTSGEPPAVQEAALAWDWARGEAVLVGGKLSNGKQLTCSSENVNLYCQDTDVFAGSSWARRTNTTPSARRGATAFYDAYNERVILFGGDASASLGLSIANNATYRWTGAAWVTMTPTVLPPPRWGATSVTNAHAMRGFLFGGLRNGSTCGGEGIAQTNCLLGDEYDWNGINWQGPLDSNPFSAPPPVPAVTPVPRLHAGLAYDEMRRRVLLFGGEPSSLQEGSCDRAGSACSDMWEWSGDSWSRVESTDATGDQEPGRRAGHVFEYDEISGEILMFGGLDGAGREAAGTWLWRPGTRARPGVRWAVPLAAGEIGAGELTGLDIIFRGGATGYAVEAGARSVLVNGAPVDLTPSFTLKDPELAPFADLHGNRLWRIVARELGGQELRLRDWCITINGAGAQCRSDSYIPASRHGVVVLDPGGPDQPITDMQVDLDMLYDGSNISIELVADPVVAGPVAGAVAQIWSAGTWKPAQTSTATPSDLAGASSSPYTTDPVNVRATVTSGVGLLPVGADRALWVSFAPAGANGNGAAAIQVDYAEMRVRYAR